MAFRTRKIYRAFEKRASGLKTVVENVMFSCELIGSGIGEQGGTTLPIITTTTVYFTFPLHNFKTF